MSTAPDRRLSPIVRVAPAKLNLTLAVTGRRPDGFHELHSVMAPLGLADRLSVAPAAGPLDSRHVSGAPADFPDDDLVLRAIRAARAAVRTTWPGAPGAPPALAARLEKRIPMAAGLAGGSSDAAAALSAALEAWGADLGADGLLAPAATLGSDVPFFLAGAIALVEGRGERVTPLSPVAGGPPGVLLVTPPVAVSTVEVFAAFDAGLRPPDGGAASRATSAHIADELRRGIDTAALLARAGILATANDLIPATETLLPGMTAARRALGRLLHRPVGQSGSGPTLWALYPSLDEARTGEDAVRRALADGTLILPGVGAPFVLATTMLSGGVQP
jgi:4-diphosphocytidyl-2-C-methyl-D-erythritol kinase